MTKENVSFIATRYQNQKVKVSFYTKRGERVNFDANKKTPVKQRVSFSAATKQKRAQKK